MVMVAARSGAARRGDGRWLETWKTAGRWWRQGQCQFHCCPGVGVVGVVPGREGRGVGRLMSGVLLGAPLLQGNLKPMMEQQR